MNGFYILSDEQVKNIDWVYNLLRREGIYANMSKIISSWASFCYSNGVLMQCPVTFGENHIKTTKFFDEYLEHIKKDARSFKDEEADVLEE